MNEGKVKYSIFSHVQDVIMYAIQEKWVDTSDSIWLQNQIYEMIQSYPECSYDPAYQKITDSLQEISSYAIQQNIIKKSEKECFVAKLMGMLTPKPSEIIRKFYRYTNDQKRLQYFFELCQKNFYIRGSNRIVRGKGNNTPLEYSINRIKPEILSNSNKHTQKERYVKCPLCIENLGYQGSTQTTSKYNLRTIPMFFAGKAFYFQYSPYQYFPEHCILFSEKHEKMVVNSETYCHLLDFVDRYESYVMGSNAELELVGGSILSHHHYQGGNHRFPIEDVSDKVKWKHPNYHNTTISIVDWPMNAIRLISSDKKEIAILSAKILEKWRVYHHEGLGILPKTDVCHHTLVQMARKEKNKFVMYLFLRDNRKSEEHSNGIFNTRPSHFFIKQENIGLMECMGLAILPSRIFDIIGKLKNFYFYEEALDLLFAQQYAKIIKDLQHTKMTEESFDFVISESICKYYYEILSQCAVFKEKDLPFFLQFLKNI